MIFFNAYFRVSLITISIKPWWLNFMTSRIFALLSSHNFVRTVNGIGSCSQPHHLARSWMSQARTGIERAEWENIVKKQMNWSRQHPELTIFDYDSLTKCPFLFLIYCKMTWSVPCIMVKLLSIYSFIHQTAFFWIAPNLEIWAKFYAIPKNAVKWINE